MFQRFFRKKGFTLIELMIAAGILAIVLTGLLFTYISCFGLNETSKNLMLAISSAEDKLEEIRDYPFNDIRDYNDHTFYVPEIGQENSRGIVKVVEVDNSNLDLFRITVTICWRQRGGRIIGGDQNLNPSPNSPVRLVTLMTRR